MVATVKIERMGAKKAGEEGSNHHQIKKQRQMIRGREKNKVD